jgi:hypothetical protein
MPALGRWRLRRLYFPVEAPRIAALPKLTNDMIGDGIALFLARRFLQSANDAEALIVVPGTRLFRVIDGAHRAAASIALSLLTLMVDLTRRPDYRRLLNRDTMRVPRAGPGVSDRRPAAAPAADAGTLYRSGR